MGRALLVIVIAACTCLLVLWLAAPHPLSPAAPAPPGCAPSPVPVNSATAVTSSNALPPITAIGVPGNGSAALPNIAPLVSPEQKAMEEYEAQRAPFYAYLRDKCASLVTDGRPSQEDRSLLVLYTARNDAAIVTDILTQIVTPYAYSYGFRHVRFYLPNPPGSVERYRLAAEAQAASPNNWQAFQR